ncbi:MAG: hypothetical protein WC523_04150 [Patescibacteria group bacterium]
MTQEELWEHFVEGGTIQTPNKELEDLLDKKALKVWRNFLWSDPSRSTLWLLEDDITAYTYHGFYRYRPDSWKDIKYIDEFNNRLSGIIPPDNINSNTNVPSNPCIQNNDGRLTCYACGEPTKKVQGFFPMSHYDVCTKCGK